MLRRWMPIAVWMLLIGLLFSAHASAQEREGAGSLASPRGSSATPPSTVPAAPLGEVPPPPPPPPPAGYGIPPAPGYAPTLTVPAGFQVDANTTTRLRVLDSGLQQLARAGNPVAGGIIAMAYGGLSIALAFVATNDDFLRNYLLLNGGANVLTGITDLAVRPNASGPSIAFTHMPMGDDQEVQARLLFGEETLRRLARRARAARLITASLDVAVGLAIIPIFLGPNDFSVRNPFDYVVLLGSGIQVVTGLIDLVTRSPAERYWEAYGTLSQRLSAPRPAISLGVTPHRGGLSFSLSGVL